jgi:hypothetical protein
MEKPGHEADEALKTLISMTKQQLGPPSPGAAKRAESLLRIILHREATVVRGAGDDRHGPTAAYNPPSCLISQPR